MDLQVLVSTMNQTDYQLLERMNINSDAIIGNQSDESSVIQFRYKGNRIDFLSFAEKGVGLNRNNSLIRATAKLSLIADDDLTYVDNYVEIIKEQFLLNPKVDVIIFNLYEKIPKRYIIKKQYKVNYFNYMRFGAARIAFRTKSIQKNSICFNQFFGGGSKHVAGEDVLFLTDCLKKKLKVIAVPVYIAHLNDNRESTWFRGYDDKYFKDRGVLFYYISKRWAKVLCLQYIIRHKKKFKRKDSILRIFKIMLIGIREERTSFYK